jgi:hypothetical protein
MFLGKYNIDKNTYLSIVKALAKEHNYNPNELTFSDNQKFKLNYKGVNFGASDYKDFIIYSILEKRNDIGDGAALKHRKRYLTRAANIKGDWKSNPLSRNNLAMKILWDS